MFKYPDKEIENIQIFSFHGNIPSLQSRVQFLNCRIIRYRKIRISPESRVRRVLPI